MQALRLSSVKRDRRLVLMFFKCKNDCSHAYVEPNMVNAAILTHCSGWYVTGSKFQVLMKFFQLAAGDQNAERGHLLCIHV